MAIELAYAQKNSQIKQDMNTCSVALGCALLASSVTLARAGCVICGQREAHVPEGQITPPRQASTPVIRAKCEAGR